MLQLDTHPHSLFIEIPTRNIINNPHNGAIKNNMICLIPSSSVVLNIIVLPNSIVRVRINAIIQLVNDFIIFSILLLVEYSF